MKEINSDLNSASQKATALKNAIDRLIQNNNASLDHQTTLKGNKTAHEAIEKSQDRATQIAELIQVASSNIKSVAQDFEALDKEAADSFKNNRGGPF